MMLQRLEEEGIKAYLQDEYTVTIDPILSNAIGGIKLMIYKDQLERAMELINSFEQHYKQSWFARDAQSTNVHFITQPNNVTNWFTALATWIFGNYAISFKKVYQCSDCGYESNPSGICPEDFSSRGSVPYSISANFHTCLYQLVPNIFNDHAASGKNHKILTLLQRKTPSNKVCESE